MCSGRKSGLSAGKVYALPNDASSIAKDGNQALPKTGIDAPWMTRDAPLARNGMTLAMFFAAAACDENDFPEKSMLIGCLIPF
jgi:hypothetical protein